MNNTEHQTAGSSSLHISRTESTSSAMSYHPKRIEYDPENMWFDYQRYSTRQEIGYYTMTLK